MTVQYKIYCQGHYPEDHPNEKFTCCQSSRFHFFLSLSIFFGTAQAQVLEEIIVTAQKKEQELQNVGVSVSAFNGEQMEALGWDNSLDVAAQTPGLVTTSNTGDPANIALFSIRGVSQLDFAEVTEGGDYVIADASLTYYSPSEALEVSLFVHNFTDGEPLTYSYDITGFGNYTIQTFGPPRWVGGKVKYSSDPHLYPDLPVSPTVAPWRTPAGKW